MSKYYSNLFCIVGLQSLTKRKSESYKGLSNPIIQNTNFHQAKANSIPQKQCTNEKIIVIREIMGKRHITFSTKHQKDSVPPE